MGDNLGKVCEGGFQFPRIYKQGQEKVIEALKSGDIEYADLTQWSFPDEFLCFLLSLNFFEYVDRTYPTPRKKQEVPIWFLISCQFLLRLCCSERYRQLQYFLNAGSILTRFGFNVGSRSIGFNDKNKYERRTVVDPDTVRKFFKDTKPKEIRNWYNESLQGWFRGKKVFDSKGLFILDQTHLVVPDNDNYKGAVKMPVDEHGQLYKNLNGLSEEQKQVLIYHPCYALSCLLHIDQSGNRFHISGYEFGPGNEDELVQARRFVPDFCRMNRGVIKELIVDRGYIDGDFVGKLKKDYGVDVLIPLKKNMSTYQDAVGIACREGKWEELEQQKDRDEKVIKRLWGCNIADMDLWDSCPVKQQATVLREVGWDEDTETEKEHFWVLGSTKKYLHPKMVNSRYRLRVQIEERNKQLKLGWKIGKFTSPSAGLMESHICFTLMTYSLLQLYLRRKDIQTQTHRMIQTLRQEERLGRDVVLVYTGDAYAVINLDDYTMIIIDLDEGPKKKIKSVFKAQKEL